MGVSHPDKLIARRMLRGDAQAFNQFFDVYFPRLYRFTRARVGTDDNDVKDIVQNVLSRAVDKIHTYRGEASLFTWLCQICRNEISDHFRRTHRLAENELVLDDEAMRAVLESLEGGGREDPVRFIERDQLGTLIQTLLDHLPGRQGQALEWKYLYGFSVREIAARLKITETATQSLLARARAGFREGFAAMSHTQPDILKL